MRALQLRSLAANAAPTTEPILGELFGPERLARHARELARRQIVVSPADARAFGGARGRGLLLARLDDAERILASIHSDLSAITRSGIAVSPAGDWLLDNFHVVEAQIAEIRATLPKSYYHELPKLAGAVPLAGYPRVYEIAIELIAHTDGRLESSKLELVINEYQQVSPLSMGELWAMPAMLRMAFIENIRRMAMRAARDAEDTVAADVWVARLLEGDAQGGHALADELKELVSHSPELTPAFLTRFVQQIRSRRTDFTPLLWLEQWIAEDVMSLDEAVQRSTQRLALTQLVMANSIASLRAITNIDWREVVENASLTERVLREDPAGVYRGLTFGTRDRYRHVVERIARGLRAPEQDVARAAIAAARQGDGRTAHIGWHLVDDGVLDLERSLGYRVPFRLALMRALRVSPGRSYLAALTVMGALILALLLSPLGESTGLALLGALLLALIPAADAAVALVNQAVTLLVPPSRLSRMDYTRGVPPECRTVVVVPIIFGNAAAVDDAVDHIEAQFLANRDPEVRFALLGDYFDAASQRTPEDAAIVQAGIDGIRALNAEYGGAGGATSPFYFLHRDRRWDPAEGVWMGWERKRGKLADFNALVLGGGNEAFAVAEGDLGWLRDAKYVITLDSDTVLPGGAAALLIGTIAHPLNRAEYDEATGRVVRGYGIMQPRVSVSLSSATRSRYAAIFAGHPGVDPYTTAVSDVYQDLYGEGTYTGKGIYDVAAFEHSTASRFPENALLSHDLIEGAFARAALVTDVEVFDDYPSRYLTATRRLHRWMRGDWQLLPWLASEVPGPRGRGLNPLPSLSRWKILDNLRRTLTPPLTFAWLVAGFTVLPRAGMHWAIVILATMTLPWTASLLLALVRPPRNGLWRAYYASLWQDAVTSAKQIVIHVAMLPHQALLAGDAIIRTLWRLTVSHRHMLEWQTATQVERTSQGGRASVWRRMWSAVALAIVALVPMWTLALQRHAGVTTRLTLAGLTLAWILAPEIASWLSAPRLREELQLAEAERATLLRWAKKHWHYFDSFATEATSWLVPDNVQDSPARVVAARTSPTNIGLQLLATISAHDLGLINTEDMVVRLERTLDAVEKLQKVSGHLMNWYELSDLRVLDPPYVSAVDSGNLAGHLVAVAAACRAITDAGSFSERLEAIAAHARRLALAMDFTLFYDRQRRLLAIGYDARSGRLDPSSYDLLASEARLASFFAVAKGDVPVEHWFHLGRSLTTHAGASALVSWSGSMFEYLMPVLVMPSRPFSLLDQTHHAAVVRQMSYGAIRGVPWGISESAYNLRDRHETYQYKAFGVPDLALKRGLGSELVVAPYASALALALRPHDAVANLVTLERMGALGEFGFWDAIDYSRPEGEEQFAIVRTAMAHHVGMSLVAIDNALHLHEGQGIWQRRFMQDPAVRAAALLLDERVPRRYTPIPAQTDEPADPFVRPARARAVVREFDDADTPEPHVGLLGNPAYCALLTNGGGGYSRAGGMDVFRWRADGTKDETGQWIYVRDCDSDAVWSAAHQPIRAPAQYYRVAFAADRAVFHRTDGDIQTRTEIVVVPRERAEIRRVTITNNARTAREIELTSYAEIVLTDGAADRAHPAFQNLFVETEWVPTHAAVLASRRPRAATEPRPWMAHTVATGTERVGDVSCETDRARFLGRGRTTHDPAALDRPGALANTAGAVLDPVASLRVRIRVEPGRSATVAFTTIVADTRDQAVQAADRYDDINAARRALALSGTEAQIELRDLDVSPRDAALYQDLSGALIYPRAELRAPMQERMDNRRSQPSLWAHGISGDLPIVLATIKDAVGLPSVRQLLAAHKYWRLKGIRCDLVILNARAPSYVQDLQDQLTTMVVSSSEGGIAEQPGGVFIRRADVLPPEDVLLLRAVAAINVVCDGVGLGDVLNADVAVVPHASSAVRRAPGARPVAAPVVDQSLANGYGALDEELGYRIAVQGAHLPPAPWANVIANPNAGFCVTERGGGFAWAENSYFYRLTPWYNDPVSDPLGEVIFLRDVESNALWTPTPAPAPATGEELRYDVVHAPGISTFRHERNGITSVLSLAVPESDPVKITRLELTNSGTAPRKLDVTSYVEWVLGTDREKSRSQVHARVDDATKAIFTQNYFTEEFASVVAFSWISEPVTSFSASRLTFIGRNRDLSNPAALTVPALDGKLGAGDDPCAALRSAIELAPGETKVIVVLLGAARSEDEVRAIIARNGAPAQAEPLVKAAVERWQRRLSTVHVSTPSPEFDALLNQWTLYQALSCRMWARSAIYQSSGAFGFRDQLQDGMAFVYTDPDVTRAHLLRAAAHQFKEGDVQHWWHEPSGRGVRTRFSDDLAWLAYCTDHYVRVTGDTGVFDEAVTFLEMRELKPEEHEVYDLPTRSNETASLYDHCVRALDKACTRGQHGLPLMGTGDWNDGLSRVGIGGQGESVWLAWFLIAVLRGFAEQAERRNDHAVAERFRAIATDYAAAVEREAWDGAWYRRAYFDDGAPLGSASSDECRIDSIAQSWSVLSGAGDPSRIPVAIASMNEHLVREKDRMILLLTPAFDKTDRDPGYIKGYLPGVRENGAQYTHAALWTVFAAVGMNDGERAFHLLDMLNPLTHARTRQDADCYKVEPYVVAADVYSAPGHVGRGGWTWYTGSASWSYRAALEGILGFTKRGDTLTFAPCLPNDWREIRVDYRHRDTMYRFTIRVDDAATTTRVELDGTVLVDGLIRLVNDRTEHHGTITIGVTHATGVAREYAHP